MSFDVILPFFPIPMQDLLMDPTISDICINGDQSVFVERAGVMESVPSAVMQREQLNAAIEQIARVLGRDITEQDPIQDLRLPDGARVAAIYNPCSPHGACVTIRKFTRWYTTAELIEKGSLPVIVADVLTRAIQDRRNILVSGGTGSGKSTMLNALVNHIPKDQRLVVIEKPIELQISNPNTPRLEAIDELPGRKPITVGQLVVAALRHRPDRIIVGEVRDHSAYDMLQAMNTGHSGSMTTVHADTPSLALNRIASLALSAHSNLDHSFVRSETADALHYVLQVARMASGQRVVTELVRVLPYNTTRCAFETETLYRANNKEEI